ncbi:MAG: hypothetical protein ACXVW1_07370 [Nocardioides sp.]
MKFTQRLRRSAGDEPANTPPEAPATPTRPPGAPLAAYAGILDGETLWLAVEATSGSLALRETQTGAVVPLVSDLADEDPHHLSVRADLRVVHGDDAAAYDVVVERAGAAPAPVWSEPLNEGNPVAAPPTRDGRLRYRVVRTPEGFLQVTRRPLDPTAEVRAIEDHPDGIHLLLGNAPTGDLLMVDDDGGMLATHPLTPEGEVARAVITADRLPDPAHRFARLAAGAPDSFVLLRRFHNSLAEPQAGVVLPELFGDDPTWPRMRMRYTNDGLLNVRLPEPRTPATDQPLTDGPDDGQEADA